MTPDTKQAHTPRGDACPSTRFVKDHEYRMACACGKVAEGDRGKSLALLMADDKLAAILKTLRKAIASLDHGDEGYSFEVEHSEQCPANPRWRAAYGREPGHDACACGLADMIAALHEAEADAHNVREQLALLGRRK